MSAKNVFCDEVVLKRSEGYRKYVRTSYIFAIRGKAITYHLTQQTHI